MTPYIPFLLLAVKTAFRREKKRCFFFLNNMQKMNTPTHTGTHMTSKQNLQIYSTNRGTPFGILAQTDTLTGV